jgi:hypothetical protein
LAQDSDQLAGVLPKSTGRCSLLLCHGGFVVGHLIKEGHAGTDLLQTDEQLPGNGKVTKAKN